MSGVAGLQKQRGYLGRPIRCADPLPIRTDRETFVGFYALMRKASQSWTAVKVSASSAMLPEQ
jgi:hypothetical protein